jgi:AcrR family transcriptional regulator
VTVSRGAPQPGHAYDDGTRRAEILETAASLIATSGLRTSMHDIADAAGIQTGSLYHHFESKEALLVELLRRYHDDLDRVADHALHTLDDPSSRPGAYRSQHWAPRSHSVQLRIARPSRSRCTRHQARTPS